MLWIINCIDKPGMGAKRAALLPTHRKYLDGINDKIFFSGPQEADDGTGFLGSLFIIDVPTRADAQGFIEQETLYLGGVFETVTIRRIRKGRFNPQILKAV